MEQIFRGTAAGPAPKGGNRQAHSAKLCKKSRSAKWPALLRPWLLALLCLLPAGASVATGRGGGAADEPRRFSVLQWNVWQEGTMVKGGYEAIVDEIVRLRPDFVTLSEVRNYHGRDFIRRLRQSLAERGETYYGFSSYDSGLLSRHPLEDSLTVFPCRDDHGSIYRLTARLGNRKVAVYTAHLDYLNCAYYDVRGYDGSTWQKTAIPTSAEAVLERNDRSLRDEALTAFLAQAARDSAAGCAVILGGDFNEPSHRDWTEQTAGNFDHHGLVIAWPATSRLEAAGFGDAWRTLHPDPVKAPGITFPADNPDVAVNRLTWTPDADERERIDFLFYRGEGLSPVRCALFGPAGTICRSRRTPLLTGEDLIRPLGTYPSDHMGLYCEFELR